MLPLDLIAVALAAFYLALTVTSTPGPFGVFERLRARFPGSHLVTCLPCASLWTAALFYGLLLTPLAALTWIAAAAGASVFAWRHTGGVHT